MLGGLEKAVQARPSAMAGGIAEGFLGDNGNESWMRMLLQFLNDQIDAFKLTIDVSFEDVVLL